MTSRNENNVSMEEEVKRLESDYENYLQEIHSLNQQLKVVDVLICEQQEECEAPQQRLVKTRTDFEIKVSILEQSKTSLIVEQATEVASLEALLLKHSKEIERLNIELDLAKRLKKVESPKHQPNPLIQENQDLSEQINGVMLKLQNAEQDFEAAQQLLIDLNCQVGELNEIAESQSESLNDKTSELERIREELQTAKNKLKEEKHKPLPEGSKGNSMFAKVEDKRKHLEEAIDKIRTNYVLLQGTRSKVGEKHAELRREAIYVIENWETETKNAIELNIEPINILAKDIEELEWSLEQLKHDLKSREHQIGNTSSVIKAKTAEIQKLEDQLCEKSKIVCARTIELDEARKKLSALQLEKGKLKLNLQESQEHRRLSQEADICRRYTIYKDTQLEN